MMEKLLIINKEPFGYHVDTYKYCQYLKNLYNITYICIEPSSKIESFENIKVKYIPNKYPRIIKGILFLLVCLWTILFFRGKIFVVCSPDFAGKLKKILFWKKMILDIRTLSVDKNENIREKQDLEIKKICDLYEHVSIISEGLREKLDLDKSKSGILPLGADIISNTCKKFDKKKLLYVGTLYGRDIEKTVYGFALFNQKYPDNNFSYDIIGSGFSNEQEEIQSIINENNLQEKIKLHGFIPNNKLDYFFDNCNIGVAFVPQTSYYEYQPSTKIYEYVLSGLFCIATSTCSNKELINDNNGILIQDSPESFAEVLEGIYLKKNAIDSKIIRNTLIDCTWEKIVNDKLIPILNII